ncbi:hypothetical protein QTI93_06005 [Clostridium perfringens]|uniref:hypothetical protein n=1 Tax=Clostridium perfringens TaxID=1502 RepID=UPI0032DA2FBF|nr:hypothetical protein [Clostridium perfringens]
MSKLEMCSECHKYKDNLSGDGICVECEKTLELPIMKDKNSKEFKLGDIFVGKYNCEIYKVINYKGKLYAANSGNMFPLDSKERDLSKFEIIQLEDVVKMIVCKREIFKMAKELNSFSFSLEWDNDFECWTATDEVKEKIDILIEYILDTHQ